MVLAAGGTGAGLLETWKMLDLVGGTESARMMLLHGYWSQESALQKQLEE